MLIELMRLSGGGGAELARRWVAALLSVPAQERRQLVEEVERRITEVYGDSNAETDPKKAHAKDPSLLHLVETPIQKPGYIQQVIRSYEALDRKTSKKKKRKSTKKKRTSSG